MESSNAPKTILLVEDSFDIQEIFTLILNHAGYYVVVANDGQDAWNRLQNLRPHAVITDLEMPKMNGLELARALKNNPKLAQIPIGLITATSFLGNTMTSGLFERVAFKPCEVDSLLDLAEFLVQQSTKTLVLKSSFPR